MSFTHKSLIDYPVHTSFVYIPLRRFSCCTYLSCCLLYTDVIMLYLGFGYSLFSWHATFTCLHHVSFRLRRCLRKTVVVKMPEIVRPDVQCCLLLYVLFCQYIPLIVYWLLFWITCHLGAHLHTAFIPPQINNTNNELYCVLKLCYFILILIAQRKRFWFNM